MQRWYVLAISLASAIALQGCTARATGWPKGSTILLEVERDDAPAVGGMGLVALLSTPRAERSEKWVVRVFEDGRLRVRKRRCDGVVWLRLPQLATADLEDLRSQVVKVRELDSRKLGVGLTEHSPFEAVVLYAGERPERFEVARLGADPAGGAEVVSKTVRFFAEKYRLPRLGRCG